MLLTFQKFETIQDAKAAASLLQAEGIHSLIEQYPTTLDKNFIGVQYNNDVLLKITDTDFDKARKILINGTEVDLEKVDKDYMLFSLSDEELKDVLAKPDEWGAYNYNLARKILQQKGIEIKPDDIQIKQEERIQQMATSKPVGIYWILFGYFLIVVAIVKLIQFANGGSRFLLIAPCYSVVWGTIILTSKTTLPNGKRTLTYNGKSRAHALIMALLGIIIIIIDFTILSMGTV